MYIPLVPCTCILCKLNQHNLKLECSCIQICTRILILVKCMNYEKLGWLVVHGVVLESSLCVVLLTILLCYDFEIYACLVV